MYLWDWNLVEGFILAFIRAGVAIALMPVFGYHAVPMQVKAGLGFILALTLAPMAAQQIAAAPPGALPVVAAAAAEAVVGIFIGLVAALILVAAEMAGTLVGMQMGFDSVSLLDPLVQHEVNVIGQMQYLLAFVIFIALDAHHYLISALSESFRLIPLGGLVWQPQMTPFYSRLVADTIDIALKLAAPVLTIILISEVALGFVARAMPQMNVFIISFPLKIGIGLFALATGLPLFVYVISKAFNHFEAGIIRIIGMAAGR